MSTPNFVKMHPMVAAAAASVIVVSLVGTAAIMDWLPNSKSNEAPEMSATTPAEPGTAVGAATGKSEATAMADATAPVAPKAQKAPPAAPQRKPAQVAAAPQPAPVPAQAGAAQQPMPQVVQAQPICEVCGKVEGVRTIETAAKPSGVGVVAGAVVGGLLGNQVGGGTGKTLATVAGAVGGGYAGNEIEKRTRKGTAWEVDVRMESGEKRSFKYDTQPSWRAGDRVKVVEGTLAAN